MIAVNSKLPNAGTSIFPVMTGLANEYNAINLAQGFPDFPTSPQLISLVNEYMKKGMNQYAPTAGILPLRERIAEMTASLTGRTYSPDTEITITAGGTQAIYAAIEALIRDGDEVIIFEPAYDCYSPNIRVHGGIPRPIELTPPDYKINWDNVKKLISHKTRMIMINTPHNPTGTILSKDDIDELINITKDTDILILSDEVYEHIVFDGKEHHSMAKYPELAERSLIVSSFGKTFHTTGWRLGYLLGPAYLMAEIRKLQQFAIYTCITPIQYAIADFMANPNNYLEVKEMYQQKRNYFASLMKATRFNLLTVGGSYFQTAHYNKISNEGDYDFAVRITKEFGVATIPTSVFYTSGTDNKVIRFCFAKKEETLDRAIERLIKI
ncbi:methionine aminotransferase [Solitalea canadensis]|uniref:Aspartate/tyrosine/aromatic aminotransferase n=1 Tax=Solitalea canadensis (strain ATCC 29591 / DSM 3403 / JCM 21819 / LMG 8368 / NBRC 15130 / NCIMB 12057 / USAM 9D) TaxID=929556 RepID=H8KVI9_SOLCM|nr:methionine aminotransferase [Solitalea canadensis]AFD06492.1 aspartate/tyrosine/aromatic aminotransferase [Solitalea canadensis DSM 3403]